MGALTFKGSAFESRPWELTKIEVPDFIDDKENLVFHLRGSSLMKITSRGWLRDRIRFSYDGYRRQRLVQPIFNGNYINWSKALQIWWNLVYNQKINLKIDLVQPYSVWLRFLLSRLSFLSNNNGKIYSLDCNLYSTIYQGSYGLECVRFSFLVLPVQMPYEELNVLSSQAVSFKNFSLSVVQFFKPLSAGLSYKIGNFLIPKVDILSTSNYQRVACFQVSPIQKFLVG